MAGPKGSRHDCHTSLATTPTHSCMCIVPQMLCGKKGDTWPYRLSPCLPVQGIDIKEAFRKAFNATPYLECTVSSVSGDPYDVGQDLLPLTSRWECCVYCHFSLSIRLEAEPFSRHPSV